jgi:hypothetical protein
MDRQSRRCGSFLSRRGVQGTQVAFVDGIHRALLMDCFGQSVCGIGIVKGYYAHQKFNVMEIANKKNAEAELGEVGRV